MSDIVRIDIKEFRSEGYLQELNRRFLHPLGLAMEAVVDDQTKAESLGGVWDYRGDPEGVYFGGEFDASKARHVDQLWVARIAPRLDALGYMIEPVPVSS